eukprot:1172854-Pleurochrysis_carterae.AAC.1
MRNAVLASRSRTTCEDMRVKSSSADAFVMYAATLASTAIMLAAPPVPGFAAAAASRSSFSTACLRLDEVARVHSTMGTTVLLEVDRMAKTSPLWRPARITRAEVMVQSAVDSSCASMRAPSVTDGSEHGMTFPILSTGLMIAAAH